MPCRKAGEAINQVGIAGRGHCAQFNSSSPLLCFTLLTSTGSHVDINGTELRKNEERNSTCRHYRSVCGKNFTYVLLRISDILKHSFLNSETQKSPAALQHDFSLRLSPAETYTLISFLSPHI